MNLAPVKFTREMFAWDKSARVNIAFEQLTG
jgi:hypothetical protein